MTHRPVGSGVSFTATGSSSKSAAFTGKSTVLRVVATAANAFVAIGTEPTATLNDYCVPANSAVTIAIDNGSARVSGITTGTTTIIDFPEGLSSPFGVGDYVTLTSTSQPYYNFTHQPVISVNNTSSYDGYFGTRVSIGTNTSGIVTAFTDTSAELRNSMKVAAITEGGTAIIYTQQIQISGQA